MAHRQPTHNLTMHTTQHQPLAHTHRAPQPIPQPLAHTHRAPQPIPQPPAHTHRPPQPLPATRPPPHTPPPRPHASRATTDTPAPRPHASYATTDTPAHTRAREVCGAPPRKNSKRLLSNQITRQKSPGRMRFVSLRRSVKTMVFAD